MTFEQQVESVKAKLQAEVGRFLILKERILSMPSGPTRDALLQRQVALEGQALNALRDLNSMKESLSFRGVSGALKVLSSLSPEKVASIRRLLQTSMTLASDIARHKAMVERLPSAPPQAPSAWSPEGPWGPASGPLMTALKLGAVAYALNWAWGSARRRARS